MTTGSSQKDLLEIYKLHAELADRVSQRREGANRLYVSLLAGIMVLVATLLRYRTNDGHETIALFVIGILGMCLAVSWYIVIRSYRQLNSGKFKTLHELEENLVYAFYTREWELLKEGQSIKNYWKLTVVETSLPVLFFVVFLGLVVLFSFGVF